MFLAGSFRWIRSEILFAVRTGAGFLNHQQYNSITTKKWWVSACFQGSHGTNQLAVFVGGFFLGVLFRCGGVGFRPALRSLCSEFPWSHLDAWTCLTWPFFGGTCPRNLPTGPTERTPKPEYLIALTTLGSIGKVPFNFWCSLIPWAPLAIDLEGPTGIYPHWGVSIWARKKPWLYRVYKGDEILPSYIGIKLNYCKDPHWTTSVIGKVGVVFFFVAHMK